MPLTERSFFMPALWPFPERRASEGEAEASRLAVAEGDENRGQPREEKAQSTSPWRRALKCARRRSRRWRSCSGRCMSRSGCSSRAIRASARWRGTDRSARFLERRGVATRAKATISRAWIRRRRTVTLASVPSTFRRSTARAPRSWWSKARLSASASTPCRRASSPLRRSVLAIASMARRYPPSLKLPRDRSRPSSGSKCPATRAATMRWPRIKS